MNYSIDKVAEKLNLFTLTIGNWVKRGYFIII